MAQDKLAEMETIKGCGLNLSKCPEWFKDLAEPEVIRRHKKRQEKVKNGTCYDCSNPSYGRTYCRYCADRRNTALRKKAKQRYKKGKCNRCMCKLDEDMDEGQKTCLNCRERREREWKSLRSKYPEVTT